MRKHQQQRIFELLEILNEAHDELARQTAPKVIVGLLGDCQEFALKIGDYIEEIEGEGTRTVSLLEEYCELLYEVSVNLDLTNGVPKLRRQLIVITNSVKDELKQKKIEIAFFPYKASMFDALESIWLAAKDDPQCDVYVVPIPYYDLLSDGQIGQMQYEGDQYPDYVPITNWQEYDVEARRPDIIYIHNPYDNGNRVTSVHPMYYSKRLRDLTDLLVYVPYFVSNGDVSEAMCRTAACIYSHKVFVQSEKVRQTYIRVYKQLAQQHGFGDAFGKAEEKFQALGSPKFDKVVNSRREDYPLPDEWAGKMIRSDGTRKKVVLYNTAISSLLTGNEAVLHKLRYVFSVFSERDDVLLWWRPHPLNGTTYASMRPELLEEYETIVREYKLGDFGIYDDSADSQRAIAMSDAYYGDGGSMVALYKLTGKPMMLQSIDIDGRTTFNPYAFTHAADDGRHLWWSVYSGNALLRMDKKTKVATYISSDPDERFCGRPLYAGMIFCGEKLFLAPCSADAIAVYDTAAQTWEKISFELVVPETGQKYSPEYKFGEVKRYNNWLFFIPFSYPAIIRYDIDTGKLDYLDDWIRQLQPYIFDETEMWFANGVQEGLHLLLPTCNANAAVIIDMETCKSTVQPFGSEKRGFAGICHDGKQYWLTPRKKGGITRWDRKRNRIAELIKFPEGYDGGVYQFIRPVYENQSIWLIPIQANQVVRMDIGDDKMASIDTFPIKAAPFVYAQILGNKLTVVSFQENSLIEWDVSDNSVHECKIIVSDEDDMRISKQGLFGDYNSETMVTSLNKYRDYLFERDGDNGVYNKQRLLNRFCAEIMNSNGSAGQVIFQKSVQLLQ